jgi:hypothetical protein
LSKQPIIKPNEALVHTKIPNATPGIIELNVVQIEQDLAMCEKKFPTLICRPIGGQFMQSDLIALFEFIVTKQGIGVTNEKHYRLVPPEQLTPEELRSYAQAGG